MAENVHQNLESMLPELEELERMGVFSSDEIRYAVFEPLSRVFKRGQSQASYFLKLNLFIICSFRQGQLQNT